MRTRWTNHEVRRLKEMYEICRRPTTKDLASAFPRHPDSVFYMARRLGLVLPRDNHVPLERAQFWMRVAHEHFVRREAGLLA
jgi:hypothetical protein